MPSASPDLIVILERSAHSRRMRKESAKVRIPTCARMRVSVGQAKLKRLFAEILVWGLASGLALAASASLFIAARPSKPGSSSSDDLRLSGGGIPPDLTFACDRPTSELLSLLSQPGVISDLTSLHAGIALDVPDLNVDRAQLVRQLNQAGIPVTAWLALPKEQGYYLNASIYFVAVILLAMVWIIARWTTRRHRRRHLRQNPALL